MPALEIENVRLYWFPFIQHFILVFVGSCRSLYGENARKLPERTNEAAGQYANACVEIAKEMGVPYINLWSKMQETDGWQTKFLRFDTTWT